MKKNHFLKLTSFILSISTLVSSLSVAPSRAQTGVSLSKEAKIGISAAAGVLSAGLIFGGIWMCHNRRENISADEPNVNPADKPAVDPVGEQKIPSNAWEVLESKLRENKSKDEAEKVIEWVRQNYKKLIECLSVSRSNDEAFSFRIGDRGVEFTIQHAQNPETEAQLEKVAEEFSKVYSSAKQSSSRAGAVRLPEIITSDDEDIIWSAGLKDANDIRAYLHKRERGLRFHKDPVTGKDFENNWQQLCYLLGDRVNIEYVEKKYPEWKNRLTGELFGDSGRHYETIYNARYESFALMSIAYSLLLAKVENYDAGNPKNNEIITKANLKYHDHPIVDESKKAERLGKVKVLEEDILMCAHNHFAEWGLSNKNIGFLNAGDPYEPCGFLPNHGWALEEYLSMNTTLIRDLSHKAFRKGNPDCQKGGFYTTREKFPPVGTWRSTDGAWEKLTGPERDFYHERGIMSKHVRLIRPLGTAWSDPINQFANFEVGSGDLYDEEFCVLSIAGLEDRSGTLVKNPVYQAKWKEITKKQCRFVLETFIKEGVQVPFLCPFGAGCFGGSASIVAECFRELLIDEGYADHFDLVVFPIIGGRDPLNGGLGNIAAFNAAFPKPNDTKPETA